MAEIKTVTADDLRQMEDQEGLVLQGCGGDLQEWVDGINDLFTEAGILQSGNRFGRVSVFQQDGLTNLLFPFDGVQLDVGKLAIWRLQTHAQFGGTWLSDYVPNRLGGFVQEQRPQRPKMELLGQDGNIFAILGRDSALLKRAGMKDQADEMFQRVTASGSYEQALNIISEYVETELTSPPIHQRSNKKRGMPMSDKWEIIQGDALKVLEGFAPGTFDAVITDPPYASGGRTQAEKNKSTTSKYSSMGENAPPPFERQSGCMRLGSCVSPARRCVCSSTGGSSPLPPTPSSGRGGSGAAPLSGIRATAAPRRAASASRRSTSSGAPTGICP